MGIGLAIALASARTSSPALARAHEIAWLAVALLMLDLVLARGLPAPVRFGSLGVVAVSAFVAGSLVPGSPAFSVVVVGTIMATGVLHQIRLARRNHAVEGSVSAIALTGVAVGLAYAWFGPFSTGLATAVELAAALLLWLGHLAWVDLRWRSLRRVGVPAVAASAVCFAGAFAVLPDAAFDRWQLGLVALGSGILWWLTFSLVRRLSSRTIWSTSGRLSDASQAARRSLTGGAGLEELATGALTPFAEALGSPGAQPELYAFQPPLRIGLDRGNRTHIRTGDPPSAVMQSLFDGDSREVLDLVPLRANVVREPAIRALVETMDAGGIGCVLPCLHLDHVEGLVLLPLGDRSEALTLSEIDDLRSLGDALGGALASALAQRRADTHIHELSALRREAEDRICMLEGEVAQLRGQCDLLGRGLAEDQTLHVAYSASMRRVQTRAIDLAPSSDPVLVVAPAGSPVLPVSRFIHDRGPRWEAPFIVADCSAVAPDQAVQLLFGSQQDDRAGWIASAAGGTLVLRDLPALSQPAQARLGDFLSGLASRDELSVAPRLIATSRASSAELQRRSALDPDLARCLSGPGLTIPSLHQRREDVPSLVLLAIDRACRVLAREPLGISQEAMAALVEHDWPGDVAELELVIELATTRASGKTIALRDLPPLAWPSTDERESLSGSYLEVERRLLQRALMKSSGNKSEAARMLGLKRTTFLDKLRRHGLEHGMAHDVSGSAVG